MRLATELNSASDEEPPKRSYLRFASELYTTRVWVLLLSRWLLIMGMFAFNPHMQVSLTNYFAKRHTDEEIHCVGHKSGNKAPEACQEAHNDVLLFTTIRIVFSSFGVSLFLNPAVGTWADMYGRKRFLGLSMILHIIPATLVVLYKELDVPLYWYFVGCVFSEAINSGPIVLAYISDVVPEEHRIIAFGLSTMMFSLGGIAGSMATLSGLVSDIEVAASFYGGCCILSTLLIVFALPESLSRELQQNARSSARSETQNVTFIDSIIFARKSFFRSMKILLRTSFFRRLTLILFLICLMAEEYMVYSAQYLQEVLGFGTKEHAIMSFCQCLFGLFLMTIGTWFLLSILKFTDKQLLVCGVFFVAIGVGMLAVVQAAWMAYVSVCCISFWMLLSMAVSSMKANNVAPSEQGAVQGALTAVSSLGFGLGPFAFLALFTLFRSGNLYMPGVPFFFGFSLVVAAFFIALGIQPPKNDFSIDVERASSVHIKQALLKEDHHEEREVETVPLIRSETQTYNTT